MRRRCLGSQLPCHPRTYWLERAPPISSSAQNKTTLIYPPAKVAQVSWDSATNTIIPDTQLPAWTKLVMNPDQLIRRRGKAGLLALNKAWQETKAWIVSRAGKPQKVRLHFCILSF